MTKQRWLVGLAIFFLALAALGLTAKFSWPWVAKFLSITDESTLRLWDQKLGIISKVLGLIGTIGSVIALLARFLITRINPPIPPEPPPPPIRRDLEPLYYRALDAHCQALRLDIVATDLGPRKLDVSLSDIYQDQHIRLSDEKGAEQGRMAERGEAQPLLQALGKVQGKRLVIRGKVGAGKTCFVNYLAHGIIRSHDSGVDGLPANLVRRPVVRLLLRELGPRLGTAEFDDKGFLWLAMRDHLSKTLADTLQSQGEPSLQDSEFESFWAGFRERFAREGVLLLDGLDEVSETEQRRARLRLAIADFAKHTAQAFIIVTGRPYAYDTEQQRLPGFQQADLEPMSEAQIRQFIRHWYCQARAANQWDEAMAERRADELAEQIFARPYLPEMASTAMLLTLFIGLDYSGKRLPSSRASLYEESVGLLLQRWNQNLKDHLSSLEEAESHAIKLLDRNYEEMLRALKKLAFDTYQGLQPKPGEETPVLEFSHELVIGQLYAPFAKSDCDLEHLLHFLQFRSALLVAGGGKDNFQFAHKSFHEYLAASHLLDQPDWETTLDGLLRGNLEWWREVVLLLVKKYSDMQYGKAVLYLHHQLLAGYPSDGSLSLAEWQRRLLLAAAAGAELAVQTRRDEHASYRAFHHFLQSQLVGLLHSSPLAVAERAEAGRLLGELGDPRPGVGVKLGGDGKPVSRRRGERQHHLPDFDWQAIPTGHFRMGTDGKEGYGDEKPAHDVDVPAFFISRHAVTNAQYRCFIEAGLYQDKEFWREKLPSAASAWLDGAAADESLLAGLSEGTREDYRRWLQTDWQRLLPRYWLNPQWNLDNHPVVGVSWFEALAYSVWLNELRPDILPAGVQPNIVGRQPFAAVDSDQLCRHGDADLPLTIRLPTEAEWEYAARGEHGWCYAWGNKLDPNKGNYLDTGLQRTSAAGLFSPGLAFAENGDGLYDMGGNVWEWTLSRWGKDARQPDFTYDNWQMQETERNRLEPVELRVIRGGSWYFPADSLRCAVRNRNLPYHRDNDIGFRLVLGSPW